MKKWTKRVVIGLAALVGAHVAMSAAYTANEAYQKKNPSEIRQMFQEELGAPVEGWVGDIEDNPSGMSVYLDVIRREMHQRPFKISRLTIQPSSFFKANWLEQVGRLYTFDSSGWALPGEVPGVGPHGEISIDAGGRREILYHEIKHIKTFEVMEENPEFRTRWEDLATDKNGESMYADGGYANNLRPIRMLGAISEQIQDLGKWLGFREPVDNEQHRLDLEERGFVSEYATFHFFEDVAELCEKVESNTLSLDTVASWLDGTKPILAAKVHLAQEYKLIDSGTTAYAEIFNKTRDMRRCNPHSGCYFNDETMDVIPAIDSFLERYPTSAFEMGARVMKADILASQVYGNPEMIPEAIEAYLDALESDWRTDWKYVSITKKVGELERIRGDFERGAQYTDAYYAMITVATTNPFTAFEQMADLLPETLQEVER